MDKFDKALRVYNVKVIPSTRFPGGLIFWCVGPNGERNRFENSKEGMQNALVWAEELSKGNNTAPSWLKE